MTTTTSSTHEPAFVCGTLPENVSAVFFDIDGTFYSHKLGRIPEGYVEMVQALRKGGVKCALSTARSYELIVNLLGDQAGLWDGIVAGNGSFVHDENLNFLFEKTIPDATARKVIEIGRKHGAGFFVSGTSVFIFDMNPAVQAKLDANSVADGLPIHDPRKEDHLSVMSVCHPNAREMEEDLSKIEGLFVQYTPQSADISRDDLSKFEGISILMDYWNLPTQNYAAFGDSFNDMEMFKHAAMPVAVHEAEDYVAKHVDTKTPPVEDGGIVAWMKQEGWLK